MASETEASCESDPNFAIICAFLEKFGETCGIECMDFVELQQMLENNQEVPTELINLHIKLLRKARKNVTTERWERALINMCHTFSSKDAWEIERFGYKKTRLKIKLRALKELLEMQFDSNTKFKNEINKMTAEDLRSQPMGRDKLGRAYWLQSDNNCQIRIYKEDPDEETWKLIAKDKEGLVSLITELTDGDSKLSSDSACNEDSNSLLEKPFIDTGQTDAKEEKEENLDSKSILSNKSNFNVSDETTKLDLKIETSNLKTEPEQENSTAGLTEDSSIEEDDEDELNEEDTKQIKRPKLRIKPFNDLIVESSSKDSFLQESSEDSNLTKPKLNKSKVTTMENQNDSKLQLSSPRESPLMIIKGNGSGNENQSGNSNEIFSSNGTGQTNNFVEPSELIFSDEIEEPVIYFKGIGYGNECKTGNEKELSGKTETTVCENQVPTSNTNLKLSTIIDSKTDDKSFLPDDSNNKTKTQQNEDNGIPTKKTFFFGPGSLNVKPNSYILNSSFGHSQSKISENKVTTEKTEIKINENQNSEQENSLNEPKKSEDLKETSKCDTNKLNEVQNMEKIENSDKVNEVNEEKSKEPEEIKESVVVNETPKEEETSHSQETEKITQDDEIIPKKIETESGKEIPSITEENVVPSNETAQKIETPCENVENGANNNEESDSTKINDNKDVIEDKDLVEPKNESESSNEQETCTKTVEIPEEPKSQSNTEEVLDEKVEDVKNEEKNSENTNCADEKVETNDKIKEIPDEIPKNESKGIESGEKENKSDKEVNLDNINDNDKEIVKSNDGDETAAILKESNNDEDKKEKNETKKISKDDQSNHIEIDNKTTEKSIDIDDDFSNDADISGILDRISENSDEVTSDNNAKETDTITSKPKTKQTTKKSKRVASKLTSKKGKSMSKKNSPQNSKSVDINPPVLEVKETSAANKGDGKIVKNPSPISEVESEDIPKTSISSITNFSFDYDPNSPAPQPKNITGTLRNLRKRGRETEENKPDIGESSGKKAKKGKRVVDLNLRKSVEEKRQQKVGDVSSDENEPEVPAKPEVIKKVTPKKKGNTPHVSDTDDTSQQSQPVITKKSTKNKRILKNLGVKEEDILTIAETQVPVRQSRRLAQLKIKEEAARRKVEEEEATIQKKKKKVDDKDFKIGKRKRIEDEIKEDQTPPSAEKKKQKKKKEKISIGWNTSSEDSDNSCKEEEASEYEYEEHHDDEPLQFKSDHEFSPESDLEEDEKTPLKRARTARKEESDDEIDEEFPCQKCGKSDHPEWILLCDNCDNGWHCSCLRPSLFVIPEGDWYCPTCQHETLIKKLNTKLLEFEKMLVKKEMEDRRKERLAYVGISLNNVLPTKEKKEKGSRKKSGSEGETSEESSASETGSSTSDSDEPIYQLRQRRQAHSYKFQDYDDLINSALQEEPAEPVEKTHTAGRGKDIATIVNAAKEEEEKTGEHAFEDLPPVVPKDNGQSKKKKISYRKKPKRLNNLEVNSDDEADDSDEDFKGSSSDESEDDFEEDSDDSYVGRKSSRPTRRSTRARTTRYDDDFINDDTDDSAPNKKKKKRAFYDDSESELSDDWRGKRKSIKKKKKKGFDDSDLETYRKKKSKKYSTDDDYTTRGRRTRGKKTSYLDTFGSESEEEKTSRKVKEKSDDDDDDEYVAEDDEEKESEEEPEKESQEGSDSSESKVAKKLKKKNKKHVIESDEDDSEDEDEPNVKETKKINEINKNPPLKSENSKEVGVIVTKTSNSNLIDSSIKNVDANLDELEEEEVEKMMENEDFANKQLQMAAIKIQEAKRLKQNEAMNLQKKTIDTGRFFNMKPPQEPLLGNPALMGNEDDNDELSEPPGVVLPLFSEIGPNSMQMSSDHNNLSSHPLSVHSNKPTPVIFQNLSQPVFHHSLGPMAPNHPIGINNQIRPTRSLGPSPPMAHNVQVVPNSAIGMNSPLDASVNPNSVITVNTMLPHVSAPTPLIVPKSNVSSNSSPESTPKKRRGRGRGRKTIAAEVAAATIPATESTTKTTASISVVPNIEIASPPQPFSQSQPAPSVITRMLQNAPGKGVFPVGRIRPKQFAMISEADNENDEARTAEDHKDLPPHNPPVSQPPGHYGAAPPPNQFPPNFYHKDGQPHPYHHQRPPPPSIHFSPQQLERPSIINPPSTINAPPIPEPTPYSGPPPSKPPYEPLVHRPPYPNPTGPFNYEYSGPPPVMNTDEGIPPPTYENANTYSEQYDNSESNIDSNIEKNEDETSGEFGGLVSYFSSQQEDDLDG